MTNGTHDLLFGLVRGHDGYRVGAWYDGVAIYKSRPYENRHMATALLQRFKEADAVDGEQEDHVVDANKLISDT